MTRLTGLAAAFFLAVTAFLSPISAQAGSMAHKVVMHVDDSDEGRMNLALNNASNVASHYLEKGEEVQIEIVAYGPGLKMLTADSPVATRVKSISENFEQVSFKGCGNTRAKMTKKAGHEIAMLSQTQMVPAGVVHLMERQEQGWTYIRP